MINTRELMFDMQKKLNMMKGYRIGSSSKCHNKMVVNFGEDQFVVSIKKVDKVNNLFGAVDAYLTNEED